MSDIVIQGVPLTDDEWTDWYHLSPAARWRESQKLWQFYLAAGGSLDDQPDSQSPFYPYLPQRPVSPDRRPGVYLLRRVDPFERLWSRHTTIELGPGEKYEIISLPD